jgi:DNA invertase Pin-like site-specific DNA recombinase
MIYGYIRISKDTSDVENQRHDIMRHPSVLGQKIEFVEETVSGTVNIEERLLGDLIKRLKPNDTLIASDVSRLGRNTLDVAGVGGEILKKKARLIFAREDWELKDELGSEIMFFGFSLAARIERSLISARTKTALSQKKSEGKILGRPTGTTSQKLKENEKEVMRLNDSGFNYTTIGRLFGVHRHTVRAFFEEKELPQAAKV